MAQVWCFNFLFLTSQSITTARFRTYTVSQRIWDSIFRKASKASQLWSNQIAELDIHKISQPWSLSQPPPKILRVFFGFWRFSIHDSIYGWSIIHFFDAIGMRWAIWPLAMTDPWCWYINASKKGVYWWDPCYHIYIAYIAYLWVMVWSKNSCGNFTMELPLKPWFHQALCGCENLMAIPWHLGVR